MASVYSLKFLEQTFSFHKKVDIYHSRNNDDDVPQYFVFLDGKLYNFKYDNSNNWLTTLLLSETFQKQVLYFPKILKNRKSIILLKTDTGIDIYQYADNRFNLLVQSHDFDENLFHDVFDWDKPGNIIKCGNFYYDKNLIGILTKHQDYGLHFHAVMENQLTSGEYPIWPLQTDLSLLNNVSNSNFFLADLQNKGQDNIIVRSKNGMDVYQFNQGNELQHLLHVPDSSKISDIQENLFFPFLTGQSFKDIILFNTSGLFIYQYNMKYQNYNFIHFNPLFDKSRGWNDRYIDTVRFKDINFDGKEEMFFTGPRGMDILTFDNYTLQWESVFDVSNISIANRHSYIVEVDSAKSLSVEYSILFTQRENRLRWANIERTEKELQYFENELFDESSSNITSTPSVIPSLFKLEVSDEERTYILLRDQIDCSSILKAVDQDTGKATFKLPLIGLPNFSENEKINFYYNGNNKASSILGVGWTFPVGVITMDHQGSIFPESTKYLLLLEDFPQQLLLDYERSTDIVQFFKLSDQESKTQIVYYKSEERWEINYRGVKQIYGRRQNSNEDSINIDLSWQYWRGVGSSPSGQTELVTAWFLTEVRNEHSAILFNYDVHNVLVPVSNKKYTREVYLKTITDSEGNKIIFKYSSKALSEYNLPPLVDEKGNYNPKKVQTRFLAGCSVITDNYRQDINFNYKVLNGKRLLTEIVQESDPTNQPILQFYYKELLTSPELERVILPTGTSVEFYYETIGGSFNVIDKISLMCNVLNGYRIDYGQDFVLISYLNKHFHVTLRMFNRALTNEIYSSLSQMETSRFPFLGRNGVRSYTVKVAENTLAFILHYDDSKEVCLIRKVEEKWSLDPKYYNYDKDAIIQIGYDFVVVLDTNKSLMEMIVWDKKSEKWFKEKNQNISIANSADLLLQVSGKEFLIYNDKVVIVGYRNENKEWHSKVIITLPGIISTIKKTLNKFNLKSDVYRQLLNHLKNNAFQISNNFILFNRWNTEGNKLFSEIELFSLNNEYQAVHQEHHKINQDDLNQFALEIEKVDESDKKKKSNFTLAYEQDKDRFKLILKDFKGAIRQEINELCRDDEACLSKSEIDIKRQVNEAYKHVFLLNLVKYLANFQAPVASCGSTKFTFNGNNWKVDTLDAKELESKWSVSMDDKFVLSKENLESSIKLYNQGKNIDQKGNLLLDLAVKDIGRILNMYPIYLVSQKENREVNIVFYEFLNYPNVKNTFILPRGETLSVMSDHYTLVTHAESTSDTEDLILNFRQFFGISNRLPNAVIKRLTINFDYGNRRVTGYDYDPSSVKSVGDILYYEKTYTIPGSQHSSYGKIEELKNITNNLSTMHKIYDAKGNLIKVIRDKQLDNKFNNKNITEESESLYSILYDITKNLEVAQFYPYEIQDEEVGYYGFENYEVNKIGTLNSTNYNRWFFNEADIVKQEFSLTGENYLRLKETRLLGTFQPNNQNQNYVASCWIRSAEKLLEVGSIAPFLKAVIYTADNRELNGYFSEIKFQYDDWYYLEVIIDFLFAQQVFSNLDPSLNITMKTKNLKTVVSVSPTLNSTLHVDHIRFSPLNSNFQATTYNFKTKEIKEIINANGLIKRYVYNDYQDRIASINENGEIEKFITSTKASSVGRIVNLKSEIEVLPNGGFYEDFNPHSFIKRWKVDSNANWKIAPSELHHRTNNLDKLNLRNVHTTFDSFGLRLYFSLQSEMSVIKFNDIVHLERRSDNAFVTYSNKTKPAPCNGEILLVGENNRLIVWIDGGLYFDESGLNKSLFDLEMYGQVKISNVLIFIDPNVHVTYFNSLNEKVQRINLEAANSVIVTEYLYDDLGRQCVTTKPTRLQRSSDESAVAYYFNFVTNKNPFSDNSVWKIERIQGEFESLEPYSYYQITYSDNPLNEESRMGLPGQEFSVTGPFAKQFSSTTNNQFINRHYPADQNYRYQIEYKLGGIEDIKVFNEKNNTVAWLVNVPGKSDLLATYEYNNNGKLTQMLTPLYHEKVGTFRKLDSEIRFFSNIDKGQHNSLYVEATYDKKGNIIAKTALDSGTVESVYSDNDLLKFNIFYSNFNNTAIENVVYYIHDQLGRVISTGKLISPPTKEKLLHLKLNKNNTEEFQVFYQSDFETEPTLRGRLKRTITYNNGAPLIEESLFNEDKDHLSKRIIILNENSDSNEPLVITTNKKYRAGKLRVIEYPINVQGEPFKLTYTYDKLGRIKAIGVPDIKNLFVDIAYNSDGQIESEHHLPNRKNFGFKRKYGYNSASYLTQLEDKFLTEKVYYTEGSYDARGYGDGTISRTEFKATWHQNTDSNKLGLNEKSFVSEHMTPDESKLCFNKLKEAGYLNQYNRQTKIYYPSLEMEFPITCSTGVASRQIQNILGKQGFPSKYGHMYDYGPYQELIKAKYFVGEDIPAPLQPDTFAQAIPNLNIEKSRDIWNILKNNGYITADKTVKDDSYFKPHGKQGNSFMRSTLYEDLKTVNGNYQYYRSPLEKILAFYFSKKESISSMKLNLKTVFSKWTQTTNIEQIKEINKAGNIITEILEKQSYLLMPLHYKFLDSLIKYQSVYSEIVKVLLEHFSKQLGESEFDVEAYDIDENGNHKHYYNGFDRYELKYRNNSNQIESINFKSFASSIPPQNFSVKHDSYGNVVQALHKGITNITYHSVSNRAVRVDLVDGKTLIFYYDAQGERILKRVLDATGAIKKEIHYIRDEFGRSLVERELTWSSANLPPSVLVTVYIYGPKGLIGFFRRDEYYSVITDHEGSIRLVVKDGEVVAAYDYLPYGNLMRQYGINSEIHISYRYTGQEWDEEIGLYNYHARFYDPSIGRFYQHDPKMQYFSPYKYAGNSPVSMIDPNGELAFLLVFAIIALGLVGAYFAGAAASGTFNIAKWNFKDPYLYVAMAFGFLGGALIPVMLPASVAAFSAMGLSFGASVAATSFVGLIGVYAGMTRASNEWDPSKWDWSRPELWNSGFVGFSTFVGAPGGIHSAAKFYINLQSVWAKGLFIGGSASTAATLISLRLIGRKLDWSKPGIYVDIMESLIFAADIPMAVHGGAKFFKTNVGNIFKGIKSKIMFRNGFISLEEVRSANSLIAKSTAKLFGKTGMTVASGIAIAYLSSENGLELSTASTYESIISGAMMFKGLSSSAHAMYKKQEIRKKFKPSEITRKKAENTVETYMKFVEDVDLNRKIFADNNVKLSDKLKKGQIPNRVLAVAITKDNKVFVAFSGEEGPGFLSTYDLKTKGQSHVLSTDNSYIGFKRDASNSADVPWKVAINDDENINRMIDQAIKDKNNNLKQKNYETYLKDKDELGIYIQEQMLPSIPSDLIPYITNDEGIQRILDKVESNIQKRGFVQDVNEVKAIILEPIQTKHQLLKNSLTEILKSETALQELGGKLDNLEKAVGLDSSAKNRPLNERLEELKTINKKLEHDYVRLQKVLKSPHHSDTTQTLLNVIWKDRFKKYFDELTHWSPTNCAEPHVVSLTSRNPEVFPSRVGAKYNLDDIEYLASYKILYTSKTNVEIVPFARCSNCQETTRSIKNIVTDPEWEVMLNEQRIKLKSIKDKEVHNYRIINFLAPYNIIYDGDKKKHGLGKYVDNARKKRAAVENNRQDLDLYVNNDNVVILENYKKISDSEENKFIDDPIHIPKEKSTNMTHNLFDWVKTSVKKLIYSQKILPESVSNSYVIKGINDSNGNFNLTAVTALVDVNSSLLLLDTMIRKVTGQKYISTFDDNEILLESRGYSLDIGVAFEKTIKYAASKSDISIHRFKIHYKEIQEKVIEKIMSGKLDEIAEILTLHAEKACPHRETGCPGKLSAKKFKKFINIFSKKLNIELNEIMQKNKRIKG